MTKRNKIKNDRRCLSCHKIKQKKDLLRIVRVYPDHTINIGQGMGRSAYICPEENCVLNAQKKLSRALKTKIPDCIYQQLWQELS